MRKRERKRERERRCDKHLQKHEQDMGDDRVPGLVVHGDDKEGTNDGGAPFREETYDIGFYARNNARAPAVRAVLQETSTVFLSSLRRSLFFSISRWRNKVGGRGRRKERIARSSALYHSGVVFYFLFSFFFFFHARRKDMTRRGGEHITRV